MLDVTIQYCELKKRMADDSSSVTFIPLEDKGTTGNFEITAWPKGRGVEPGVLVFAKRANGQGHVDSDEKYASIVSQLQALLA
ncbi:Aste57867_12637 [Aphanomyces stellatus]|uniref:Aste57867_12637 protein n=1 Tax=Aphanomyces stellatus TaxID=120398 RepID=A0A485KW52_9STRA|nr:hypothetical protein As57867_012591 [Aphanomyces stellatus]VFT89487.1 Aste57867_12637 [Aphanomyces stellatus]